MKISALDKKQISSILKALAFAFCSGFTATFGLLSFNVIEAAVGGTSTIINLSIALLAACCIGGINAVAVFIQKLYTPTGK